MLPPYPLVVPWRLASDYVLKFFIWDFLFWFCPCRSALGAFRSRTIYANICYDRILFPFKISSAHLITLLANMLSYLNFLTEPRYGRLAHILYKKRDRAYWGNRYLAYH